MVAAVVLLHGALAAPVARPGAVAQVPLLLPTVLVVVGAVRAARARPLLPAVWVPLAI